MQDYQARRAARSALLKRQMLLKWIAGFSVTIAAAVVAAFIPASAAEAAFLSVSAAGSDIAYETYVDASLDPSSDASIRVVARDQFGDREQTVSPGRSAGVFTGLDADTEYRLLIEIDSGFGWRTLARTTVTTDPGPGGAIVGYAVTETGGAQWETFLAYAVSVHVADPEGTFSSVTFRHSYLSRYEVCDAADPDQCPLGTFAEPPVDRWMSATVTGSDQTIDLPSVWRDDYRFYWILEAQTTAGETVTLDRRVFDSAPVFFAYMGVYDAGVDWLDVSAHVEQNGRVDATFEAVVSTPDGDVVERFDVLPSTGDQGSGESSGTHRVDRLLRETEYHLELFASYVDPTTGYNVTASVATAAGRTTPYYAGTFDWTESDAGFDFTASYDDPDGILGPIRYVVYLLQDGQSVFYDSGAIDLATDGDLRTAAFTIAKPGAAYRIMVIVDKTPASGVTYTELLADIERVPA